MHGKQSGLRKIIRANGQSSVFGDRAASSGGARGPFLQDQRGVHHLPFVIRLAYKASLIPRRLHWPEPRRAGTEQSPLGRGISCRRETEKEGRRKGGSEDGKERSRRRPLIHPRFSSSRAKAKECTRPDSQSPFVTLVRPTEELSKRMVEDPPCSLRCSIATSTWPRTDSSGLNPVHPPGVRESLHFYNQLIRVVIAVIVVFHMHASCRIVHRTTVAIRLAGRIQSHAAFNFLYPQYSGCLMKKKRKGIYEFWRYNDATRARACICEPRYLADVTFDS